MIDRHVWIVQGANVISNRIDRRKQHQGCMVINGRYVIVTRVIEITRRRPIHIRSSRFLLLDSSLLFLLFRHTDFPVSLMCVRVSGVANSIEKN
jgi:hypothetical protein